MKKSEIDNAITHLKSTDKIMAGIIDKAPPCPLKPHNNYYYSLLEAIVGQQLSMKAAESIMHKFDEHFLGNPVPESVLAEDDTVLRSLGLSNSKVKYVKDLSLKVLNKELKFRNINKMSDEEIIEELIKVKGIGVWTAHMFLIFTLGRPDVLPVGDLGIKKAIMNNYKLKELPDESGVEKISQKHKWSPYNTVASWYLWKSLEF